MDLSNGTRLKAAFLALAAAGLVLPAGAVEQSSEKRTAELKKLTKEFDQSRTAFWKQYMALKTDQERRNLTGSAPEREFSKRFLDLAKANPDDTVGETALVWLVKGAWENGQKEEALNLLFTDEHMQSPGIIPVFSSLSFFYSPIREKFLLRAIEKSNDRSVRGAASYTLAKLYEEKSPDKAEALFKSIMQDFKDFRVTSYPQPLDQMAQVELFAFTHLGVGKPAPPLEGVDVEGKKLALSEFKGKIVLVDFFGDW